ncbi:MAG: hypothetical protein KF680_08230 [Cryobacterium sp.]|nr:hypothetical protein [Cryobacterium sp.]
MQTAQQDVTAQSVPYRDVPGGQQWEAGDFAAAYALAVESGTVEGQLLAARSAADQAVYRETGSDASLAWLEASETAAQAALALQPDGPLAAAATMALARAKGEAALHRGLLANSRLPGELRTLFERVLELQPGNPDALVALGAWHLELTERGVGWLYGGRRDDVLPLIERGVAAAPEQINLRVEYAIALRALGRADDAAAELATAMSLTAVTAVDKLEQERAARLLDGGDPPR